MDKNTLYGLLLMGLVIFGFMWLQQPSQEEIEKQRREAAEMAKQEQKKAVDAPDVMTVDSVSAAEIATIKATVKQFGSADTVGGNGTYRLASGPVDITLDQATGNLAGTVKADGIAVPVDRIIAHNYEGIDMKTAKNAVKTLTATLAKLAKYQGFSAYVTGDSTTVNLSNDVLSLDISNKGAMIARAKLLDKRYISYDSAAVELLSPRYGDYGFTLTGATQRFDSREFYFKPVEVTDSTVLMQIDLGDGVTWGIRYTLPRGDVYTVRMDMVQDGMEKVIPASVASMDFDWTQRMPRNEAGRVFEERNSAIYYKYTSSSVDNLSENSSKQKEINERLRWVAFKNQFFSAVLIADRNFNSAVLNSEVLENDPAYIKDLSCAASVDYKATDANPASFTFYFGPNLYPLLSRLSDEIVPEADLELTRLIPLGWTLFRWINTLVIIPVFTFLGKFITDYGIIILLLTIFIKIVLFPFTYKSYMSQARMRVLSPEIKAINEKYPGKENAMKRQQETMALYSRAGASPMSGCLPMLLQLPILIAMFNFFPSAIELRGEPFLWAKDLSAPDAIVSWTANIPLISSTFGNHISLFCLLMTVTNVIYSWFNMQNQPGGSAMPGMKWMSILMPLMFLVFFNNYASGLSYYYFLSLLITIIQMWVFRKVVSEEKVRAQMAANAKKPKKKSGFMARLEEAQRRQQQMLREQQRQQSKGRR